MIDGVRCFALERTAGALERTAGSQMFGALAPSPHSMHICVRVQVHACLNSMHTDCQIMHAAGIQCVHSIAAMSLCCSGVCRTHAAFTISMC